MRLCLPAVTGKQAKFYIGMKKNGTSVFHYFEYRSFPISFDIQVKLMVRCCHGVLPA
jgi:hypothetical protein